MPIANTAVVVGTAATLIAAGASDNASPVQAFIRNDSGVTVFLGGSGVTTVNGIPVATGSTSPLLTLSVGDALYACVAAATQTVQVYRTRS